MMLLTLVLFIFLSDKLFAKCWFINCRLGRYAVESYLEQILSHGFFHADPVSAVKCL